uniref:Ketoreductase domain-containing protein n=1 Tax=Calcidiscus leptoporus TaxID=127549 RepID=A0A7S0IX00_9EUKA|mmetsp:Transcript_26445/g.61707  ORF Transcript_26445/g.61707 Transcript_26445/m.61707 type:complete len:221 (+) Transcript_26445:76-738(+)
MTAGIIAFGLFALGVGVDVIRRLFFLRRRPLNGKHVLVTGGSSGIGKELARTLLHKSARVTLLARTESKLKEAADELRSSCAAAGVAVPSIAYVCADIAQQAALSEAISQATTVHGSIDVLICNAGSATPGLFLDMPVETFAKQMDVNYLGTLRCIKAVTPSMVQRGDGQVIIVASACAVVSFLGYSSYAPTKFALRGLADALRNELIGFGVSVKCLGSV